MGGYRRPWPSSGQATFGGHKWGSSLGPLVQMGLHPPPTMDAAKTVGWWMLGYRRFQKTEGWRGEVRAGVR